MIRNRHFLGIEYTFDKWLKSPYSSYEYAVIHQEGMNSMQKTRDECQALGGELAYAGLFEEDAWE